MVAQEVNAIGERRDEEGLLTHTHQRSPTGPGTGGPGMPASRRISTDTRS